MRCISSARLFALVTGLSFFGVVCPAWAEPEKTTAQDEAAKLVRTALQSEAAGSTSDRQSWLDEALQKAPNYAPARWLAGYVRVDGRWYATEDVQKQAATDSRLEQYRQMRDAATDTVEDNARIARWCRLQRLNDEERVHWLRVLELQPDHLEAQGRLRMNWVNGSLMTAEQLADFQARTRKVEHDLKQWKPRVLAWGRSFQRGTTEERDFAFTQISNVTDPAAIRALEWGVSTKELEKAPLEFRQAVVSTLAAMSDQEATEALVRIAVTTSSSELRNAGAAALKSRPVSSYAPMLLGALVSPVTTEYSIEPVGGTVVYHHKFFRDGAEISDYAENDTTIWTVYEGSNSRMRFTARGEQARSAAVGRAYRDAVITAAQTEGEVLRQNQITKERNDRIQRILSQATSVDLPAEPSQWWKWWQDYNDTYTYGPKPVRSYFYGANLAETYTVPRRCECFARGTTVWTLTGPMAIEKIKPGDRVLSQDPDTGELAYKPVVRTTLRPEGPMLKISLNNETLSTTRGHLFWVAGYGWQQSRNLKPGTLLHGVGNIAEVETTAEAEPAEAYNMIVADFGTYFVGKNKILSHDNSMPKLSSATVPGYVPEK